jgi:hypothetical protein
MAVLNHHIVAAVGEDAAACFLAGVGLEPPARFGPFPVLEASADVTVDFMDAGGQNTPIASGPSR